VGIGAEVLGCGGARAAWSALAAVVHGRRGRRWHGAAQVGGARAECKRWWRCLRAAAAADERGRGGAWSAGDGVHRQRRGIVAAQGRVRRRFESDAERRRREGENREERGNGGTSKTHI
jgi:hypothetical protein